MRVLAEVLTICGVAREDVTAWIERRWVLPVAADGDYLFSDADVARAQMIAEFRRDLAIDDDAMSMVLDLVDQLHAARRRLKQILEGLNELPEPYRQSVLRRLDLEPYANPEAERT